jgi:hypothetical protein
LIDLFDPAELEDSISQSGKGSLCRAWKKDTRPQGSASSSKQLDLLRRICLDLVIAIGAQCTSEQKSQDIGKEIFREIQHHALSKMVQDPSLEMVKAYLLMAFYMLGECHSNKAYMYLSVAARAAIALGLHSPDSYAVESSMDTEDRLRFVLQSPICAAVTDNSYTGCVYT